MFAVRPAIENTHSAGNSVNSAMLIERRKSETELGKMCSGNKWKAETFALTGLLHKISILCLEHRVCVCYRCVSCGTEVPRYVSGQLSASACCLPYFPLRLVNRNCRYIIKTINLSAQCLFNILHQIQLSC